MMNEISLAEKSLLKLLADAAPLAVAVSGGADSTLLAKAAAIALSQDDLLLLHVRLPFSPPRETRGIMEWAKNEDIPLKILDLNLLENDKIRANDFRRCYYCKKNILQSLICEISRCGFANIADGTVTDDFEDYRPGLEATAEYGVLHPLADAGFDKRLTRLLARRYNLPNWNMPASACLASRIPCGTPITLDALKRISDAENFLTDLSFAGCRVRHLANKTASVEVVKPHFHRLLKHAVDVEKILKSYGFNKVILNEDGYRRGAMNDDRNL
jgi:uncharacterized protein